MFFSFRSFILIVVNALKNEIYDSFVRNQFAFIFFQCVKRDVLNVLQIENIKKTILSHLWFSHAFKTLGKII